MRRQLLGEPLVGRLINWFHLYTLLLEHFGVRIKDAQFWDYEAS